MAQRTPATLTDVDEPALQFIRDLAQQAAGAAGKVQIGGVPQPEGYATYYGPDGKLSVFQSRRPWRQHALLSIDELKNHLQHWGSLPHEEDEEAHEPQPVVWYCPERITVVLDDGPESQRRDTVTCPLLQTDAFRLLQECASGQKNWDHRQFITVLRTRLWDCLGDQAESLIKTLRTVNSKSQSDTTSDQQADKSHYGTSITTEATSKHGKIPEELTLSVRLYTDPALIARRNIRCALERDPQTLQFWLIPLAGQLEDALAEEMELIASKLTDLDAPVFYGKP